MAIGPQGCKARWAEAGTTWQAAGKPSCQVGQATPRQRYKAPWAAASVTALLAKTASSRADQSIAPATRAAWCLAEKVIGPAACRAAWAEAGIIRPVDGPVSSRAASQMSPPGKARPSAAGPTIAPAMFGQPSPVDQEIWRSV